ncbi:MAG: hypothetical protein WCE73_04775 [Candidatus Angelobacter sp.]
MATLKRKGQNGLLSAIGDQKDKGRISPTGSVGTGSLAPLCKITFNKKNEIQIENFGQKPFCLVNVRRAK